jgi:RNA polymerase sigma-70 factor (ECF subfamily)
MHDEAELIDRAQAGDRDALDEIVAECWQGVYRLISYKTHSPEDAKDIAQETFFRAFRSLPTYKRSETRFSTYLGRIAVNLVTDFWRKKGRSPNVTDISDYQNSLSDGLDPGDDAVRQETNSALAAALKELSDEQRQVIELRILAGLPVKDTAEAMKKSEAAVKMLQQRALKNLREILAEKGVVDQS